MVENTFVVKRKAFINVFHQATPIVSNFLLQALAKPGLQAKK